MVGTGVAVVLFGASVAVPVSGAGADQIAATRDQIVAMEATIQAGAVHLHQLALAFDQANLDATTLAQEVSADQAQIGHLESQVQQSRDVLEKDALLSYTGAASAGLGVPVDSADPAIRSEYLQIATGDIDQAVDQYRTGQELLASSQANLVRQEKSARAAAASAELARQQALALASSEQAQLNQLQVHLNQLVVAAAIAAQQAAAERAAQQAAAQRAAEEAAQQAAAQQAAAQQAAQQAAARQAAQEAAAEQAQRSAQTATQGLPVNNGLVTVVRTIVAPAPPPPPPPPAPAPTSSGYTPLGGVWLQLRECESGDNYAENTGNGYYGAYQFSEQTWSSLGYPSYPYLEPPEMQDQAAEKLQAEAGWGQWPACAAALGLLG
jgi:Transglycosylase-like domain